MGKAINILKDSHKNSTIISSNFYQFVNSDMVKQSSKIADKPKANKKRMESETRKKLRDENTTKAKDLIKKVDDGI